MFDLEKNTTPKLYQYIIQNNLQDRTIQCILNFYDHIDLIIPTPFYTFAQMFEWEDTPEGHDFWRQHDSNFNQNKFKFLKV